MKQIVLCLSKRSTPWHLAGKAAMTEANKSANVIYGAAMAKENARILCETGQAQLCVGKEIASSYLSQDCKVIVCDISDTHIEKFKTEFQDAIIKKVDVSKYNECTFLDGKARRKKAAPDNH